MLQAKRTFKLSHLVRVRSDLSIHNHTRSRKAGISMIGGQLMAQGIHFRGRSNLCCTVLPNPYPYDTFCSAARKAALKIVNY